MNLKNDKFNYARKYQSICKYFAIALPLLLLLIACIFPTKQIYNRYALEETTTNIQYKYETNEVNNENDLIVGNIYHLDNLNYVGSPNDIFYSTVPFRIEVLYYYLEDNLQVNELIDASKYNYKDIKTYIYIDLASPDFEIELYLDNGEDYTILLENIYDTIMEMYFIYNNEILFDFQNLNTYGIFLNGLTTEEMELYNIKESTIINNTYNQETLTQVNETKQPNEAILQPLNLLYKANINSWYDTFLTAFELNYEDNNYMYYLVHYPLYILYVVLLDLLLDIILLVPCLLHRLVHKYKGDV